MPGDDVVIEMHWILNYVKSSGKAIYREIRLGIVVNLSLVLILSAEKYW